MCHGTHVSCVEVRGFLVGVTPVLPWRASRDKTLVTRFGRSHLHPLSYVTGLRDSAPGCYGKLMLEIISKSLTVWLSCSWVIRNGTPQTLEEDPIFQMLILLGFSWHRAKDTGSKLCHAGHWLHPFTVWLRESHFISLRCSCLLITRCRDHRNNICLMGLL